MTCARRLRVPAHLAFVGAEGEAGRSLLDGEGRDAVRPAVAGAREDEVEVGGAGAGDELLGAVEDVVIADLLGAGLEGCGIRARARLGQAVAGEPLHRGELRYPALDLLRRAGLGNHPRDHVVDRDIGRDRGTARRQRLHDKRAVEPLEAGAALLFGHVDRRHPERRRLANDVDREMHGLIPGAGVGRDPLAGERECRLLDRLLFVGEGEVHHEPHALVVEFGAGRDSASRPALEAGHAPSGSPRGAYCDATNGFSPDPAGRSAAARA